ncbi:YceI family protein [Litoribacter ruber]|uniref:YceI family protein n=1 Tax=Litoribacter ruber TaxID=702568 RepID=UPI001BDB6CC8|nr:YceI family protein [Litoribacter ruber]MBT0810364.1 YceI family protein [Litoribacter ruber]
MAKLFILILILGQAVLMPTGTIERAKWKVSELSRLEINGNTNVTPFNCVSVDYSGNDILFANDIKGAQNLIWSGEIVMQANNFDCANNIMTKDFRKTVQAEDYPEIKIKFISLQQNPKNNSKELFEGKVEISLAGVANQFPITCQLKDPGNGKKKLTGEQTFKFSDFQIEPPVKFLGAVRVKDEVTVNFDLILEAN